MLDSYKRAEAEIEIFLKENSSIEIAIDIQRDIMLDRKFVSAINDTNVAQIMFYHVIGEDYQLEFNKELEVAPNEFLYDNLALSFNMQRVVNELYPNFTRKIVLSAIRRTSEFIANANNVAFRREASTSSEVIYRLQSGTIVTAGATSQIINNDGYDWRFVYYNGVWDYVADMYLDDAMS